MTQPVTQASGYPPRVRTYSAWFRRILSIAALVTAILPAPIMYFQLLPAYSVQAKFLIFYGPLVCLIALSYLLYIRDTLARSMFADLLDPPPEPDPYYGESLTAKFRQALRRIRSIVLTLLPVALLLTSSYCVMEYLHLINRSAWEAADQKLRASAGEPDPGARQSRRDSLAPKSKARTRGRTADLAGRGDTARAQPSVDSLRRSILRTAQVDEIPLFTRLNILYIGIFLSAEIAFILMALKEYAKEAIGLSERDLLVGLDRHAH